MHVGRKSKRKVTSFIHLHKKAKNRLFSSIFSSLLILFSFREKRWREKHRKRKHQQKNYQFTPASIFRLSNFIPGIVNPSRFYFFEKHPQSVIIFLDFFLLGGFQFSFFHFLFTISSHTLRHTHTHTRNLPITNIGIKYLITSPFPKNFKFFRHFSPPFWILKNIQPMCGRFWRRQDPSWIAHFSRFLGSRLTSLAITTFSQQNVFGGSSLSFPLFSCMERNFLAPTSKG